MLMCKDTSRHLPQLSHTGVISANTFQSVGSIKDIQFGIIE